MSTYSVLVNGGRAYSPKVASIYHTAIGTIGTASPYMEIHGR